MTCREIIIKYLNDNGFDGLCNLENQCGCGIDDAFPCYEFSIDECEAAHAKTVTQRGIYDEEYGFLENPKVGDIYYVAGLK